MAANPTHFQELGRPPRWRGEMRFDEPLSEHTSWRVGGPAERFYRPADLDDLACFLADLPASEPLFWLGLGTNLLVRDGGIRGTVICTKNRLKELTRPDSHRVHAEAGVPCAHVARFAADQELSGTEFLAGIPGTMGGALAMNAGAFGGETWPLVEEVSTIDRFGVIRKRRRTDFQVGYRRVGGVSGEWFVSADLKLAPGDVAGGRERIRGLLARRSASQPTNLPNCGSVFRNPEGDHAARLIEACGLKGHRIGGACVSEKHANFIINTGDATAADLEALIGLVQSQIESKLGVHLSTEVRIVGEASHSGSSEQ
jgi:UDP-N-acetylmuramate dehydrogenase